MHTRLIAALFMFLAASQASVAASAEPFKGFPDKPIHLVVPFPPGGTSDTTARIVSEKLRQSLKQPVIVENRSGVGGSVGSEYVARSPADGYTVVWGTISSHAINIVTGVKIGYDMSNFEPVIKLMEQPLLMVVPVSSTARSFQDLVGQAKSAPKGLTFGSAGTGTTGHLTGEILSEKFGMGLTHVPYKGSMPMLTDLIGGQIDLGIDNFPAPYAQVQAGRLKPLAVTSKERSPLLPDVPALAETIDGFSILSWQGIFAPKGTPPEALDKLFEAFHAALSDPEIAKSLLAAGTTPAPSASRQEFADFVTGELTRWKDATRHIQAAGQ